MCIMFHLMMGWVFCCRKTGLVKKLIGLLMLLVAVQYAKDLVFMRAFYSADTLMEHIATSLDMVTVPLYVLILVEFCRPGWLTMRVALYFELPFMLLSVLFMSTQYTPIYYAMVALSAVYGVGCALWTLRELPRYHRRLKEEFSYDEDINLHWMRGVMILFFGILIIWIVGNIYATPFTDLLYMSSSLVGWSVVCYFINKQEVVLFRPGSFNDTSKAADDLRNRKAVIVNMENVDKAMARRVVDFLSGCVYALDGDVKKIAQSAYLFCPHNMDIVGDLETLQAEVESYI